jgi:hypothetical protein
VKQIMSMTTDEGPGCVLGRTVCHDAANPRPGRMRPIGILLPPTDCDNLVAGCRQPRNQVATDMPGGTDDGNAHSSPPTGRLTRLVMQK